jgi:hypothetical protein
MSPPICGLSVQPYTEAFSQQLQVPESSSRTTAADNNHRRALTDVDRHIGSAAGRSGAATIAMGLPVNITGYVF